MSIQIWEGDGDNISNGISSISIVAESGISGLTTYRFVRRGVL